MISQNPIEYFFRTHPGRSATRSIASNEREIPLNEESTRHMAAAFTGLIAVVTGAGSGIGLATAQKLADGGARVFGLDISPGAMNGIAEWIDCDIGSAASVDAAFALIEAQTDVLDILVNNAGIGAVGSVEEATDDDWANVLNINVVGIARVSRHALPLLRRSRTPAIVNTCSIAA